MVANRFAILGEVSYGARRMKAWARLKRTLSDQRGQGATEYILVAMLTMIPLIALFLPTMLALRIYLRGIYSFVGMPIP